MEIMYKHDSDRSMLAKDLEDLDLYRRVGSAEASDSVCMMLPEQPKMGPLERCPENTRWCVNLCSGDVLSIHDSSRVIPLVATLVVAGDRAVADDECADEYDNWEDEP